MSKSLSLALVISLLAAAAGLADPVMKTITINCDQGQGIQQALAHPAEQLIIQINGMCQERVVINRHDVSLIGSDPATDGITGPALDNPLVQRGLVRIEDARNVRLENLTITASEGRGIEALGGLNFVDIVNCRITGNEDRGLQMIGPGLASVVASTISDNGGFDISAFSEGQISCTGCTIEDDDGITALAVAGGIIELSDSTVSTGGAIGALSLLEGHFYGSNTSLSASVISLYASENSQITWNGGDLAGSIWADLTSQIFLAEVNQTANLAGNLATDDSHFRVQGGTLMGDTRLSGFSDGTFEVSSTLDTLTCDRGGDAYCDGTETKTSSSCGLCP